MKQELKIKSFLKKRTLCFT